MGAAGSVVLIAAAIALVVFRRPFAQRMESRARAFSLRRGRTKSDYTAVYEIALVAVGVLIAAVVFLAAVR
jgi:hypothetical protein